MLSFGLGSDLFINIMCMNIDSRIEENGCSECGRDAIYVEDFTADTNIIICNNEDCRSFSKEDASAEERFLDIEEWRELVSPFNG